MELIAKVYECSRCHCIIALIEAEDGPEINSPACPDRSCDGDLITVGNGSIEIDEDDSDESY